MINNMVYNYFEKEFELRFFEMNKFGQASPTTILTLLEETASDHCYSINHSLYDLEKQNIGWVLISGYIEMSRYPIYKEKIKIITWLSNYSLVKGERENLILDKKGEIIGRAKGLWVFFDIKKRRPIQILNSIKETWSSCSIESINHNILEKIPPITSQTPIETFIVKHYDVDTNQHVSNIKYLQWLIETIPKEIIDNYFLQSIDGRFISEANYGDTIHSFIKELIEENSFLHTIRTGKDNKICATAKTKWKRL